jgi:hypothetical protein
MLLSAHGDLTLDRERAAVAGQILEDWTRAANALSRKMSGAEYLALPPITVLTHSSESVGGAA